MKALLVIAVIALAGGVAYLVVDREVGEAKSAAFGGLGGLKEAFDRLAGGLKQATAGRRSSDPVDSEPDWDARVGNDPMFNG